MQTPTTVQFNIVISQSLKNSNWDTGEDTGWEITGSDASPFRIGEQVEFTSNLDGTVIRFVEHSPFDHPAAGELFAVGKASKTVIVTREGPCNFDCGVISADGKFVSWGGYHTP